MDGQSYLSTMAVTEEREIYSVFVLSEKLYYPDKNYTIILYEKRSIVFGKSTNVQQLLEAEGLKNVEQQE